MFKFLFKKKIEEDTGCKCNTFEDQDTVVAKRAFELKEFERFLRKNNYEYEIMENSYRVNSFNIVINGKSVGECINNQKELYKKACLSCESCLGWHDSAYTECKSEIKSLDKYFQEKVDNHIQEIRKEKQRVKLAKEICEC